MNDMQMPNNIQYPQITQTLEPGSHLLVGASHTGRGLGLVGHRQQMIISSAFETSDVELPEGGIYQVEFSSDKYRAFPRARAIYNAVKSNLRDTELGGRLFHGFRELYRRYLQIPAAFSVIPSDNQSRWFTEAQFDDPDVFRRREPADMVVVTPISDHQVHQMYAHNEAAKRRGRPYYNMLSVGDAVTCSEYCNDLAGTVGMSDEDLFGAEKQPYGYISGDTRRAVGRFLKEKEGEYDRHLVPIPQEMAPDCPDCCIRVYNVTFMNGVQGAIIISPHGAKLDLQPVDLIKVAHASGALRVPGLKAAEQQAPEIESCRDRPDLPKFVEKIAEKTRPNWLTV